jgi:DNA mismatch repair protein MutS2
VDSLSREVLEFEKVEAMLASKTSSIYGRKRAGELRPFRDVAFLAAELKFVQELKDVAAACGRPFALDLPDLDEILARCRVEGARLTPESLRDVAKTLAITEDVVSFVKGHAKEYLELAKRTRELFPVPPLRASIDRCIDPASAEIADACSRHLREVRREKERVRSHVLGALEKILSKQRARADDFITIRSDRYVIPVDSHQRFSIKGIVHDTSSSGATLFVEPMEVVELNNRLSSLHVMEKEEENRILSELTARVAEHVEILDDNIKILGELDLAWAKGALSTALRCARPEISERGRLRLLKARHPLLVGARGDDDVVPLDLEMGENFRTLVISGPNMGGKTVALKTVGLLALMMACGLHVPAGDGSELPLFDEVYADIGDGQSIEENLSTFAAHVRQLGRITEGAGSESLVLLDEIGAGTDPHEGGALARAALRFLTERRTFCIATTHLGTLKPFVADAADMVNGCMEFDTSTLTPKYVLHVGSPGRSMAIEMARQLGLPEALIKDATSQLSASELKMDALLADAEQARGRAKKLEAEAEKAKDEAGLLRNTLQRQVEDLASRRRGLEREAKESCRKMTAQARREIETLLDRSRKSAASEGVRKALKRVESLEDGWTEKVEPQTPPARDLSPGSRIWVNSLGVPAELVTIMSNGRAIVERRGVRVEVPVSELREFEAPLREKKASGGYSAPAPAEGIAEILLLGLAGDEAVEAVERQIDAALLQGVNEMKIIHGKGTGVLRKRISKLLSEHLAVESFRLGEIWEGGSGVTIVRLK